MIYAFGNSAPWLAQPEARRKVVTLGFCRKAPLDAHFIANRSRETRRHA
jgi:hypothetical protein